MLHLNLPSKLKIILVCIIFQGIAQNSRAQFLCGFDAWLNQEIQQNNYQIPNSPYLSNFNISGTYTIPVVYHLVGNAALTYSDSDIVNSLVELNKAFSNQQGSTELAATDAKIKFCLAQNTPNFNQYPWSSYGATMPGITRHSDSLALYVSSHITATNYQPCPAYYTMDQMNIAVTGFDMSHYLNIFIVDSLILWDCFATPLTYVSGIGYPLFYNYGFRGAVVTGIDHKLVAHEVGHVFSLLHTFHDNCAGMTSLDCSSSGDRCCDTPPMMGTGCSPNTNTCTEGYTIPGGQNDMLANYMSYSGCTNTFSYDQCDRMQNIIANYAANFVTPTNFAYTGISNGTSGCAPYYFSSNFKCFNSGVETQSGCVTDTFSFSTLADSNYTYTWTFAGGTPSSISGTTFTNAHHPNNIHFNTQGVHAVQLTTTDGISTQTTTKNIVVSNCFPLQSPWGNWYCPIYNAFSFESGIAKRIIPDSLTATFASATISDSLGNLLFYTDGVDVWHKNGTLHEKIINGNGTLNGEAGNENLPNCPLYGAGPHGVVIVPRPLFPNYYFIYTTSNTGGFSSACGQNNYGVSQYLVDATIPSSPIVTNPNAPIHPCENYKLSNVYLSVPHANGKYFWLISKGIMGNATGQTPCNTNISNPEKYLFSYLIDENGISNVPVRSETSFTTPTRMVLGSPEILAMSPNKKILVYGRTNLAGNYFNLFIYFFDAKTGILNEIGKLENMISANVAFSPNSRFLYADVADGSHVQIDLQKVSLCGKQYDYKEFEQDYVTSSNNCDARLGPDGRIYYSYSSVNYAISGITHFPDSLLTDQTVNEIGHVNSGLNQNPYIGRRGFNNIMQGNVGPTSNNFKFEICSCGEVSFVPYTTGNVFYWDFGDGDSISGVNSIMDLCTNDGRTSGNYEYPKHIYQNAGTYVVTMHADSLLPITHSVTITTPPPIPPVITAPISSFCFGANLNNVSFLCNNYNSPDQGLWEAQFANPITGTGFTFNTNFSNLPACVKMTVLDTAQCKNANTIQLDYINGPITITGDSTICYGEQTTLIADSADTYLWLPGNQTTASITVTPLVTTTYTVTGVTGTCVTTASITVVVNQLPLIGAIASSTTICFGDTVYLNGTGGQNYSWTASVIDSIGFAPNTTTTYTVTGLDANGCTGTSSITIVVLPLPNVSANASPTTTVCNGQLLTLFGLGAQTYNWSGGVTDAIPFYPTSGATYSVVGTDSNGCKNSDTISITVNALPNVGASVSPNDSICPQYPITLNGTGATTYSWSGSVLNGLPFVPSATNTYTVTGTNAVGCTSTATIQVVVLPLASLQCCNPAIVLPPFTTISSLITYFNLLPSNNTYNLTTNLHIALSGTIVVNENFIFAQCPNIFLAPGTELVVTTGKTLSIVDNTVMQGCAAMWKGITANQTNSCIQVSNSTIRDMDDGLVIGSNAVLKASAGNFFNNHISVQLNNIDNTSNTYLGYIRGCNFKTMSGNLLAPYATEARGENGIIVNNCKNLFIVNPIASSGYINTFEKLYNGIFIKNTQSVPWGTEINTRYNKFFDIQGGCPLFNVGAYTLGCMYNPINTSPRGCAIYVTNIIPSPNFKLNHVGISNGSIMDFDRCKVAIMSNGSSTNIEYNNCHLVDGGFLHYKTDQAVISVFNNNIDQTYLGVLLNGNGNQGGGVSWNTIDVISPTPQTTPYPKIWFYGRGIDFSFYTNNPWSGSLCNHNQINSGMADGVIGINAQNLGTGIFESNQINFTNTGTTLFNVNYPTLRGFNISNSFYHSGSLRGNTLSATYNALNQNRKSCGMYVSKSKNGNYICNQFNNLQTGLQVIGNCEVNPFSNTANTNYNGFKGNKFNSSGSSSTAFREGILFRHLGSTGTIGNVGDLDHDNNNTFGNISAYSSNKKLYSFCGNVVVPSNNIFTNPNTLNSIEVGSNNFNCSFQPYSNLSIHQEYNCSTGLYIPKSGFAILTATEIADNNLPYSEFEEVADWMDENELFKQLQDDSVMRNSNILFQTFYAQQSQDATEDIVATDELLAALNEPQVMQSNYSSLLNDADIQNEEIVSIRDYEINEQIINRIYITYLEQGTEGLGEEEAQTIEDLAWQCPFIAGSAVYKARMLYALYNPLAGYDDIDICNAVGVYKGGIGLFDAENNYLYSGGLNNNNANIEENLKVYPNPTNDIVNFEYSVAETNAYLSIYDITGRKIIEANIEANSHKISINMDHFDKGIYTFKINYANGQLKTGKIILD